VASEYFLNPRERSTQAQGLFSAEEYAAVRRFFSARPDLAPTPLRQLPGLAARLGLGDLLVKDESTRFGLNAFKVVGVTYALERLVADGRLAPGAVVTCATAGNHGRAVAHVARGLGLAAHVYVPAATVPARIAAIESEGATVVVTDGSYDQAVRLMAREAKARGWTIVSDTSWEGYEEIPRLIMAGYTWILTEIEEARKADEPPPDGVIVQGGVGGLVAAAASWFACRAPGIGHDGHGEVATRPCFVAAEPVRAACLLASARAGRPTALTGGLDTVMAGLRCAEVSPAAWPAIAGCVDAFVAIDDRWAEEAMRRFANPSAGDPAIVAGASGACGLGALLALVGDPELGEARQAIGLGPHSRVLLINTEGASDPQHYSLVLGGA
jgi:diaminopropionate ammonia-lyase